MAELFRPFWWHDNALHLIDQRVLPHREHVVACRSVDEVAAAIRSMQVRGAPAIGCTAAYGMLIAAQQAFAAGVRPHAALAAAQAQLDATRPTAVNLMWATARMRQAAAQLDGAELIERLHAEADAITAEDLAMCRAIGQHGVALIPPRGRVLTHCNAGGLATAGYGTALAPIRTAHEHGRPVHVYVDETRPFLQGARLTAWELQRLGISLTLITDSMAAVMMQQGAVDCVIVGADRIVANGDVANKIGTYGLAVLARAHDIPFYVAAPSSTIDLARSGGEQIPIEQRDPAEVTTCGGVAVAPSGVAVANPAFDVTPARLVSAIITERGVITAPYHEALPRHGGH
jgi:methylthioribose-1-phosphate isomerase